MKSSEFLPKGAYSVHRLMTKTSVKKSEVKIAGNNKAVAVLSRVVRQRGQSIGLVETELTVEGQRFS